MRGKFSQLNVLGQGIRLIFLNIRVNLQKLFNNFTFY